MSAHANRAAEALRRLVDPGPGDTPAAERRARFVAAATRQDASRPRSVVYAIAAVASLLIVAGGLRFASSRRANHAEQAALSYQVGDDAHAGNVGAYFAPAGELPLRFSDGSLVTLLGSSRARVTGSAPAGASILLETGSARVEVVHRPQSAWTFATGPFTVAVTGTSFALSWEPVSGTLEVRMFSGTVVVRGPGAEGGVPVRGVQRFVSPPSGAVQGGTQAEAEDMQVEQTAELDRSAPVAQDTARAAGSPEREKWSALSAHGEYQRVMDLAHARGIETTLATADALDLSALGDAAKYTGHAELARRALLAIRSRFSGTPRAVAAAFLLGRILDDTGSPRAAIEWYDRYLAEGPDGSFAPEAFGRRMLALRRAGQEEASRRAAEEYEKRFPRGTYAGVAHEIAGH